jgi:hypothetical protein
MVGEEAPVAFVRVGGQPSRSVRPRPIRDSAILSPVGGLMNGQLHGLESVPDSMVGAASCAAVPMRVGSVWAQGDGPSHLGELHVSFSG